MTRRSADLEPPRDKALLRQPAAAARQALPDRLERAVELQEVLRVWLVGRRETTIGAYWPIKGEFDPLPALYRWTEARRDGDDAPHRPAGGRPRDRARCASTSGIPGCPMELDAYDIPKPKDTDEFAPQLLRRALPRLRPGRRAPRLRRRLLRPHAARAARRGRSRSA